MRKLKRNYGGDLPPTHWPTVRTVVALALGILGAPLVYEASALCAAQWNAMYGTVQPVKTPVLDTIGALWTKTLYELKEPVARTFANLPWKPSLIIPLAGLWAFCCVLLLRRK
jgi:hypothetical protein